VKLLAPSDMKNSLITNIAAAWAQIDATAARKWADQLPEGLERQVGLTNVAESWADTEPKAAAEFSETLPRGIIRQRAIVAVMGRWVTQSPIDAARWGATIDDPETQRLAMSELMNLWAVLDPQEAGDWIRSLAKGATAQAASAAYVDAVLYWAPDLAAERALVLDPGLSEAKLVECFERWNQLDQAGARRWLDQSHLPDELVTRCRPAGSTSARK
jgi:hypothetical protein